MSTFKSFASQPSLGDYLIRVPDETAKIKEQTRETVRQMNRAEQFRQGNAELYLRAQKLAQEQEEYSRKLNYDLETNNRKLYRDALDRDNNIQIANDRVAAQQQQNTYQQLAQFSKTAADLFVDFNTKLTEKQTSANTVNTLVAGTTFEENLSIQGMVNNLTEAEFAQQSFIKKLVSEGKDVKALWTLYNNRNTRGFIENAGVIQNTANGAGPYLQEVLKNLDPKLTPEQRRLQVETAWREWLANSFKDANGRQLNPKLVANLGAPIYSRAYTNVMGEFDKEELKFNEEQVKQNTYDLFNTTLSTKGIPGLIELYQADHKNNLGAKIREDLTDWALLRLEAGTLSTDDALALTTFAFEGPNKTSSSWSQQHPNDPNLGRLRAGAYKAASAKNAAWAASERAREIKFEQEAASLYETLAQDGNFTNKEYQQLEKLLQNAGLPGYKSPVLEAAYKQRDAARFDAAQRVSLDQEVERGTLTLERLNQAGVSFEVRTEYLQKLDKQNLILNDQQYKDGVKEIKALISEHPRIAAARVGSRDKASTIRMQTNEILKFKRDVLSGSVSISDALNARIASIANKQKLNSTFTPNGEYAETVPEMTPGSAAEYKQIKQAEEIFYRDAQKPWFRKEPEKALKSYGVTQFQEDFKALQQGQVTQRLRTRAGMMGLSPLAFANFMAPAAGAQPITVAQQLEQVQNRMTAPVARLLNAYPTESRSERARYQMNKSMSTAPTRARFNVVQSVSNDPRLKGRTSGPVVYDASGHGGANMHLHLEFATQQEALAAKALYESRGYRISSFIRADDTDSAHSGGFAIDVAPPTSLPYNEQAELEWLQGAYAVIGYDPTQIK